MSTSDITARARLVAILMVFVAATAFATGTIEEPAGIEGTVVGPMNRSQFENRVRGNLWLTSLHEYLVTDWEGDRIGEVVDSMLDLSTGHIVYVLVRFDAEADVPIAGGEYPIPPYMLSRSRRALSFTVEDLGFLENAPTVSELSQFAAQPRDTSGWRGSITGYWTTAPLPSEVQQARAERRAFEYQYRYGTSAVTFPGTIISHSSVVDQTVYSETGAELGNVRDFVANFENGNLYFAELSLSRSRGGNATYLLPVNAFVLNRRDYSVEYPLGELGLPAAYGYDGDRPDIDDPAWFRTARRFFNRQRLGLGYAGGMRVIPRVMTPVSFLTGYSVLTADATGVGSISDIMVTRDGRTPYAVVEMSGFLGFGGRRTLVPMNALSVRAGSSTVTLDILDRQLEGVPSFPNGRLPDTSRPGWDEEFREYWRNLHTDLQTIYPEEVTTVPSVEAIEQPAAIPASALYGFDVVTRDGRGAGRIEEVMIDMTELKVGYLALSVGGFLDIGDKNIAVPMDTFAWDPENSRLVIGVSRQTLEESPGFEEGEWPESGNAALEAEIADYWSGEL